jgi:hypothetical protein
MRPSIKFGVMALAILAVVASPATAQYYQRGFSQPCYSTGNQVFSSYPSQSFGPGYGPPGFGSPGYGGGSGYGGGPGYGNPDYGPGHNNVYPIATAVPVVVTVPVANVSYNYQGAVATTAAPVQVVPNTQPTYLTGPVTNPTTVTVPSNPLGQMAQPQAAAGALNLTDAQIDALINRITERLQAQQQGAAPAASGRPAVTGDAPARLGLGGPGGGGGDAAVIAILDNPQKPLGPDAKPTNCAACHTGPGSSGGFKIFESKGVLAANVNWTKIWDRSDNGTMPPIAQKDVKFALSDADVNTLRTKLR